MIVVIELGITTLSRDPSTPALGFLEESCPTLTLDADGLVGEGHLLTVAEKALARQALDWLRLTLQRGKAEDWGLTRGRTKRLLKTDHLQREAEE